MLTVILLLLTVWLFIGIGGAFLWSDVERVARYLFPAGALVGVLLGLAALVAINRPPELMVLPIGLPQLPVHLRLDALSAVFLFVLGMVGAGVSVFASGYFRHGEGTPPGLLALFYHMFLASQALVLLCDDAYSFMVAWEVMALSSFFLVVSNHKSAEIRQAGFLYLLLAHIGAIAILLCFAVLQSNTGDYTFANMRLQSLDPFWSSCAFLLALFGFGAKAGMLPLHVWLPEAHPAAPSPVSALMSAVMIKTAIYGLIRVLFDLQSVPLWWWGTVMLALGLATALFGVVFAAVQTDMKRLLAYSSIENIGLLLAAIGLALLFRTYGLQSLATLALTAGLFHVIAHAFFKSLLFLGTGSVLHATGERNLGRLGGLLRYMPWVGWLMLIGVFAGSGLPPMSTFVSEWMLLQTFLFTPALPQAFLSMFLPVLAATVALIAALAGYVMVKFFGVVFLGQPRESGLSKAQDANKIERAGMLWLALWSVVLGVFPHLVLNKLGAVTQALLHDDTLQQNMTAHGWWLLTPIAIERASYGPLFFLLGAVLCSLLVFIAVRRLYHGRLRRADPWDCGHPWQNARMQDTAEGFGQPIRQIFEPFFRMSHHLPTPFDSAPHYQVKIEDHFWHWLYLPVARLLDFLSQQIGRLQRGRISVYLLYSFLTLLFMLLLVK